eukprot:365480-Chlamydomonas_euryale.AAC.6
MSLLMKKLREGGTVEAHWKAALAAWRSNGAGAWRSNGAGAWRSNGAGAWRSNVASAWQRLRLPTYQATQRPCVA